MPAAVFVRYYFVYVIIERNQISVSGLEEQSNNSRSMRSLFFDFDKK